ncbi:ODV-E56 [Adoxophyes orana nucleopolyhedrovirus]|uniref:ODV-E56 n=1 Tax=Adoxophyes orana nucleopolyhedrovirus TaxID=542343 RepID=UPI0001829BD9|nr:ODV-E56 [Adoxophyes orana nucleopolyhedrovirus]ACF05300.1 ODV-E56 [Adoxophyes orana nucleopolyhedrovirus]
MSFFTSLRRVNRVYTNPNQFVNVDNLNVLQSSPSGFQNVFSAPTYRVIGDSYVPGYSLSNNQFISTADMNRIMRNNDTPNIRNIFPSANDAQINSVGTLRRADNVPDANLHSLDLRKTAVKNNYPSTNTRSQQGVENVLEQQPRLRTYLENAKIAGVTALVGAGVYLAFSAATLVQDIISALNNTGGSYYYVGTNGGDDIRACILRDRTCQLNVNNLNNVTLCDFDPLLTSSEELANICRGFNYAVEQTVCRASDPTADVNSPQYVDISDLPAGQTIQCVEPYLLGDLIGDLGLDHLLGEEGLVVKSLDKSKSLGQKLLPLILILGGLFFIVIIGIVIFKRIMSTPIAATADNVKPI